MSLAGLTDGQSSVQVQAVDSRKRCDGKLVTALERRDRQDGSQRGSKCLIVAKGYLSCSHVKPEI